jgi:4-diphosphocytidyl-2-C-methyl-D-erythritol kinase
VKVLAPAKINIFLEVVGRRKDGYHNLESIMQTVSLYDRLTIKPAPGGITLKCSRKELPVDRSNLVMKAALLLKNELKISSGADIYLEKKIPLGAGLGGGSSDAAAALNGLLKLWKRKLPEARLNKLAAMVGADVPFFLCGGTAVARGIGERLEKLKRGKTAYILLVNPGFGVATKTVYENLSFPLTKKQKINRILELFKGGTSPRAWKKMMYNRLEEVVLPRYPEIESIKDIFRSQNCECLMSGSGSTVFGVVPGLKAGKRMKSLFERSGWKSWLVHTIP